METASASVIFVMSHYDLHCEISTRSGRVIDVLNDHTTRYLHLDHVRFCHRARREPVLETNKTVLVKDNVHLAILVSENRSKEGRAFFAAREKKTVNGVISLPNAIVQGEIHIKSTTDATAFLSIEATSFFAVTDATVLGISNTDAPLASHVVLVKKDAITTLTMARDR